MKNNRYFNLILVYFFVVLAYPHFTDGRRRLSQRLGFSFGVNAGAGLGLGRPGFGIGFGGGAHAGFGFDKGCYGYFCSPPPAPPPKIIYIPAPPPGPTVYVPGPPVYIPIPVTAKPTPVTSPPGTYDCCIVAGEYFCNSMRCRVLKQRSAWDDFKFTVRGR